MGTSAVAPLYAGLIAVLRSASGVKFGFLNPTLYQLATSTKIPSPFNDITHGNNDSGDTPDSPYIAGQGWDPCTGWGSIDGTMLLNAIKADQKSQRCLELEGEISQIRDALDSGEIPPKDILAAEAALTRLENEFSRFGCARGNPELRREIRNQMKKY